MTGASAGVGKESARLLAAWGADVIMAVRNPEKGEAVRADIQATTGSDKLEVRWDWGIWDVEVGWLDCVYGIEVAWGGMVHMSVKSIDPPKYPPGPPITTPHPTKPTPRSGRWTWRT